MKHIGTRELESERLILRRFTPDDDEKMFNNWASDDRVTEYITWRTHKNIDDTKKILDQWIQNYDKDDFYLWAIVLKEINEPVGSIGVTDKCDVIEMVHMGYCTGPRWWNTGITSEALGRLIKYFFEEVGVNRIEAQHFRGNENSGKVMQKCGMQYEGCMRQAFRTYRRLYDTFHYAILAEDFKAAPKKI